jgi:fido (protein-threonine AMPylation protein)
MPGDPYSDPATGVMFNKLGLGTAAGLEAAEREITHAALILLHESTATSAYDQSHLCEIHRRGIAARPDACPGAALWRLACCR